MGGRNYSLSFLFKGEKSSAEVQDTQNSIVLVDKMQSMNSHTAGILLSTAVPNYSDQVTQCRNGM